VLTGPGGKNHVYRAGIILRRFILTKLIIRVEIINNLYQGVFSMEAPPFEQLRRFFERIKNVGFFERLFSWRTIVSLGYDAFGEYQRMQDLLYSGKPDNAVMICD